MLYFRRSRFIRFVVLPLTLIAILPACYKWTEVETTADSQFPDPIRVTLMDGRQIVVEDATVTADSLFGRPKGTPRPVLGEELGVRVSLNDVQKVEQTEPDEGSMMTLIAIFAAVMSAAILAGDLSSLGE